MESKNYDSNSDGEFLKTTTAKSSSVSFGTSLDIMHHVDSHLKGGSALIKHNLHNIN